VHPLGVQVQALQWQHGNFVAQAQLALLSMLLPKIEHAALTHFKVVQVFVANVHLSSKDLAQDNDLEQACKTGK